MPREFTLISELMALNGKRAIVTGGDMGIGFAISHQLVEAGVNVVIADDGYLIS